MSKEDKEDIEFLKELVKRVKTRDQKRLIKVIENQKGVDVNVKYDKGYGYVSICPECGSDVTDNYCQNCGLKLKWKSRY